MKREFHWFANKNDIPDFLMKETETACICFDFEKTKMAFELNDSNYILSTQSYFFSQDTIDRGYKLFAHFSDGHIVEVKRAVNPYTNRKIGCFQNLERLLLSGEFGAI
jgi:hypothetical protein